MRLYVIAAAALLAASAFVLWFLDDDAGPILAVAGVLFWVSGILLIGMLTFALGRRMGVSFGGRRGACPDDESAG